VVADANRSWRHAKVTDRGTRVDFGECFRDLVDEHYRRAEKIRVVLDNLPAHRLSAVYERFQRPVQAA
jgi:hypothetical protein